MACDLIFELNKNDLKTRTTKNEHREYKLKKESIIQILKCSVCVCFMFFILSCQHFDIPEKIQKHKQIFCWKSVDIHTRIMSIKMRQQTIRKNPHERHFDDAS